MMRCDDELVQLYVDGALHPAEAALVEAHLESCAACRRRAGTYKSLYWDLSRLDRLAPAPTTDPDALAEQLLAEYRRHQPTRAAGARSWDLSTLWLTANPAVTRPARTLGSLGQAGVEGLLRAGGRTLRALLRRRKGGG
ncbi:anti-sigma factor RsiW [Symbiobacterium terraclitae]|uniref:Anti-sigma-W factor RsiW n=1 Tax=Symbiobacterium terraclitae TaxID=557451 RepID=A0ABS4JN62_9FIRM|nr:zf-HC2 domain-containing protein [Symbiobacterium terraclitae]MBP2016962.1 anti-sigma factor RsiW [Symbiobacterium terraclitae]